MPRAQPVDHSCAGVRNLYRAGGFDEIRLHGPAREPTNSLGEGSLWSGSRHQCGWVLAARRHPVRGGLGDRGEGHKLSEELPEMTKKPGQSAGLDGGFLNRISQYLDIAVRLRALKEIGRSEFLDRADFVSGATLRADLGRL